MLTITAKKYIDLPFSRPLATLAPYSDGPYFSQMFYSKETIVSDTRQNEHRVPFLYYQRYNSYAFKYNPITDGWTHIKPAPYSPYDEDHHIFHSGSNPTGVIGTGATTTKIPLSSSTILQNIGVNQMADKGDGVGYYVKIIGNSAGSSGKTEYKYVVANSGETQTPTIILDSALTFTPVAGDTIEILSGSIYYTHPTSYHRRYDILTDQWETLSTSGMISQSYHGYGVALDENIVPYNKELGGGYFGNLVATATAALSITGQATLGDSGVLANEFRNFQVRIVEDTATPTAVGQRRKISSHTAGASAVYTLASAWTVTPSSTATFVIENDNDKIIHFPSSGTNTYCYNISSDTWDTTTFAAAPSARYSGMWGGCSFAIEPDAEKYARNSNFFIHRGNSGTGYLIDKFDIAGSSTGSWTADINYGGNNKAQTNSYIRGSYATAVQNFATQEGKFIYTNNTEYGVNLRFDVKNLQLNGFLANVSKYTYSKTNMGCNIGMSLLIDGTDKLAQLIVFKPYSGELSGVTLFDEI